MPLWPKRFSCAPRGRERFLVRTRVAYYPVRSQGRSISDHPIKVRRRHLASSSTAIMSAMKKILALIGLLVCSNTFMNVAWYGHLKFKDKPVIAMIFASWGIAFFEYCFQVPANRIGSGALSVTQLKVIQEVITLITFVLFAYFAFKEKPTANHAIAFLFLIGAAYFATKK